MGASVGATGWAAAGRLPAVCGREGGRLGRRGVCSGIGITAATDGGVGGKGTGGISGSGAATGAGGGGATLTGAVGGWALAAGAAVAGLALEEVVRAPPAVRRLAAAHRPQAWERLPHFPLWVVQIPTPPFGAQASSAATCR